MHFCEVRDAATSAAKRPPDVLVAGSGEFCASWRHALLWCGAEPLLLTKYVELERHLWSRLYDARSLLLIDTEIFPAEGPDGLSRFFARSNRPLLVLVTSHLTAAIWPCLGASSFMILPPPGNTLTHRLVATRLLDLCSRERVEPDDEPAAETVTLAGGIVADFRDRRLRMPGGEQTLGGGEAALLRYLLRAAGCWKTTGEISREVFRRLDPAGRNLVWKYASTLRIKLGDQQRLVQCSRSLGYRVAEEDLVSFSTPGASHAFRPSNFRSP